MTINERCNYIIKFLDNLKVNYNILKYQYGCNIEYIKYGKNSDKELIFFAHYDVYTDSFEGANDNTSSVAILLNIIDFISNYDCLYTVKIVFVDKEEIIGALLNTQINQKNFDSIIQMTGSYQYLKNYKNKDNIVSIFNLELSGIGDSIFFAKNSGFVSCDKNMLNFLKIISNNYDFKFVEIPFLASDMISIRTTGFNGVVYGAIPEFEGIKYNEKYLSTNNNDYLPISWKNIHSKRDNIFTIQEKSLQMIYKFTILIIKNLDLIKQ